MPSTSHAIIVVLTLHSQLPSMLHALRGLDVTSKAVPPKAENSIPFTTNKTDYEDCTPNFKFRGSPGQYCTCGTGRCPPDLIEPLTETANVTCSKTGPFYKRKYECIVEKGPKELPLCSDTGFEPKQPKGCFCGYGTCFPSEKTNHVARCVKHECKELQVCSSHDALISECVCGDTMCSPKEDKVTRCESRTCRHHNQCEDGSFLEIEQECLCGHRTCKATAGKVVQCVGGECGTHTPCNSTVTGSSNVTEECWCGNVLCKPELQKVTQCNNEQCQQLTPCPADAEVTEDCWCPAEQGNDGMCNAGEHPEVVMCTSKGCESIDRCNPESETISSPCLCGTNTCSTTSEKISQCVDDECLTHTPCSTNSLKVIDECWCGNALCKPDNSTVAQCEDQQCRHLTECHPGSEVTDDCWCHHGPCIPREGEVVSCRSDGCMAFKRCTSPDEALASTCWCGNDVCIPSTSSVGEETTDITIDTFCKVKGNSSKGGKDNNGKSGQQCMHIECRGWVGTDANNPPVVVLKDVGKGKSAA